MSGPRVAIVTLGCKVNTYDSASIGQRLGDAGCRLVAADAPADVVVVNSCTVTERACADVRKVVARARREHPGARIIVTGCWAQAAPSEVGALGAVDHVIGIGRMDRLVETVVSAAPQPRVDVEPSRAPRAFSTYGARVFPEQTRAFLKVQEGCDLFCTFCIVPMARGRSRSLEPRRVVEEVAALAAQGFEEVVLTGVHLGGYGEDLRPAIRLADLVEMLAERALIPRLRLSSVDPHEVDERLLGVMRDAPSVCDHLHVPLQSGDDDVLRRMRRRYDTALAAERLAMIRAELPQAHIGTDLIAGFPGEDEAAFERTLAFVAEQPITYAHVFPYSPRRATTAAKLPDRPAPGEGRRRAAQLRRLCGERQLAFLRTLDGMEAEVLVERGRDSRSGLLRGYTRNYTRVVLPGPDAWAGRRVRVRLSAGDGPVMHAVAVVP
ncbi:MAG TPA: tRNA (N(6)-L-threonylcarbamoyladenosine(37)-C(2))-methylthiotransferase MtaB [Candidatus Limnocylindria bacterium]|nr:tRNA (N(6)-L-threonylcarbamoyladenosine(37)-C(2))-methylthiotransferase MtaB [Candidatus Limnocylindria bacterium]